MIAATAQNGARVEFISWPHLRHMPGYFGMALVTRKPNTAALEPDRNDIAFAVIVSAASLVIHIDADHVDAANLHFRTLHAACARTQQDKHGRNDPARAHEDEPSVERTGFLAQGTD